MSKPHTPPVSVDPIERILHRVSRGTLGVSAARKRIGEFDEAAKAGFRKRISELSEIAYHLHWMARRYADGRQSTAPSRVNDCARKLLTLGVQLNETGDGTVWARDGGGRSFDGLSSEQAAQGKEPDWTWTGVERENERLKKELDEVKSRYSALLTERDRYRMAAEQKMALRVEFEDLLGMEKGRPASDEVFREGVQRLRRLTDDYRDLQGTALKLNADLRAASAELVTTAEERLAWKGKAEDAARELADLQATFDLMFKANQRAIKLWQEAHPDKADVWPDHTKMVIWLMEELDKAKEHQRTIEQLTARLETAGTENAKLTAYTDKLAAGLPEGCLPKDIANLREANASLAEESSALQDVLRRIATHDPQDSDPLYRAAIRQLALDGLRAIGAPTS